MKKLGILILFIAVLTGCKNLNNVSRNAQPVNKPVSLIIEPEKKVKQDWRIEVEANEKETVRPKNEKVKIDKDIPDEFVFPRHFKDNGKALTSIKHEGELIDFTFNFKDADIKEVIHQLLGKILSLDYIIDNEVVGTITLNTSGKIYKDELFSIVQSMLDINGFTLAKDGKIYNILPVQDTIRLPGQVYINDKVVKGGKDIITQIVPLEFVVPQDIPIRNEIAKKIKNFDPNLVKKVYDKEKLNQRRDSYHGSIFNRRRSSTIQAYASQGQKKTRSR